VSIASELERLAALLDRGLITREEFDQEKRVLLANSTSGSKPSLGGGSQPGIGKSLGAYNILGMVGRGGMGVVYRARHRSGQIASRQGGDVALKVLHAQYSQDPAFQERFEREATLGLKLDHAGIVKVYDLIVAEGGRLALTMELVSGTALSHQIGQVRGPIPWREAIAMFDGLLDAVRHAHSEGVTHRDLKPDNIMVSEGGGLKVLDFGIARDESSGKTKTGTGIGTVDYMAPEQYTDASKVDARADIYALGMTMYEMVAGRLPWVANATEFEILTSKAAGNLPPPTQFYPDIPPELVSVIEQAMDVDLDRRCQSADAFRSALKGVIRSADAAAKKALAEEAHKARASATTAKRAREEEARKARIAAIATKKSLAEEEKKARAAAIAAKKIFEKDEKKARAAAIAAKKAREQAAKKAQRPSKRPIRTWMWLVPVVVCIVGTIGFNLYSGHVAEEAPQAEEVRLAAKAQQAEEARLAAKAQQAEEARLAQEAQQAEEARLAQEARQAERAERWEDFFSVDE
jgi:hypothetical protein